MDRRLVAGGRYMRVLLCALTLALGGILAPGLASSAFARTFHAVLIQTEPADGSVLAAPPAAVRLWFTEPVQLVEPSLTIYGPAGKSVAQGKVQAVHGEVSVPLTASAQGTYLVIWQVISQDTDPVSGSFRFSIGHPGGVWTDTVSSGVAPTGLWLQILARLLHYLGYALGFGTLLFLYLVVYPCQDGEQRAWHETIWRLVNLGILILLGAEGVALLAQSASLGNHALFDLTFLSTVLASSFGRTLALRLGAALALWTLVGLARQDNRPAVVAAMVLGAVLALIDSLASHAITAPVVWLAVLVTALHLAAMGTWLGGLIALLLLWRDKAAQGQRQKLLVRFSPLALAAVLELVLSGVLLAGLHLLQLSDLWTTTYGRVLGAKILLLALPLLFVALSRRRRTSPARWWRLELLALLVLLVLAGLLTSLPPVR